MVLRSCGVQCICYLSTPATCIESSFGHVRNHAWGHRHEGVQCICEVFHAKPQELTARLIATFATGFLPVICLCRLLLRQPGLLCRARPRCWNTVPSAHGARFWGRPCACPSVHGASLPRHWPHGFAPLMLFASADYLLYFCCCRMPELPLIIVQTQFIPGPLFLDR